MSKKLSQQDLALWQHVTKNVRPLGKKRAQVDIPEPIPSVSGEKIQKTQADLPPRTLSMPPLPNPQQKDLELPLRRKLSRGKIQPDLTLDLHGLNQAQAYTRLLLFLKTAQQKNMRIVCVVTGKGGPRRLQSYDEIAKQEAPKGVLRRAVPEWLAGPEFAPFILGFGEAAPVHGGSGALYVHLRKLRQHP